MERAGGGWLLAGRAGRPHGLDGSFYVADPVPGLLAAGAVVRAGERMLDVERVGGTDRRPLLRLAGISDRDAAAALSGTELYVPRSAAPPLEPDEWWADDLEGCRVRDGAVEVGTVKRLLGLPSCEVLEVVRADGGNDLLVPLVADAVRAVDVERREIEIDLAFLGEA